jgi:hypothetical protein
MGGFGVVLYIILWVSLPEARTTTEKVEMTQGRVTLSAIQQKIDEVVPPERRKGIIRRIIGFPVLVIGTIARTVANVVKFVVPLFGRLVGAAILLGIAFAIAGATFVFLALLINPSSPYIGFPLKETVGATGYLILLSSAYFAALVPLLFGLLAASSLMLLRNLFSAAGTATLVSIWFVALVGGGVASFTYAPQIEAGTTSYLAKYHDVQEQLVNIPAFSSIEVGGNAGVHVTHGFETRVALEGTADTLKQTRLVVKDGKITLEREAMNDRCLFFCPGDGLILRVQTPALEELTVSDSAYATIQGFSGSSFHVQASGAAWVDINGTFQDVEADASGVAQMNIHGKSDRLKASAHGNAMLGAASLSVVDATVDVGGNGALTVSASKTLSGSVSENGSLWYAGNPIVTVETSGNARIDRDDELRGPRGDWEGEY